ncbi:hypothetical protein DTF36_22950 [Salmonella enterica subsp. enterica]|nr:hypothetical protein [Salmonella enterica subsp. enterica]MKP47102.1 hypothetical protein [Salmonella enterica subsp. enterica]
MEYCSFNVAICGFKIQQMKERRIKTLINTGGGISGKGNDFFMSKSKKKTNCMIYIKKQNE